MEKEELVQFLTEGLSAEEIPTMGTLNELKILVINSDLDDTNKKKIMEGINKLIKDTLWHSKAFSNMMKKVSRK